MRRSLAPSALARRRSSSSERSLSEEPQQDERETRREARASSSSTSSGVLKGVTIERQPMFDFLSIPAHLKQVFRVPDGVEITEESIRLRKRKTLGAPKVWREIRPGSYCPPLPLMAVASSADQDEDEEDENAVTKLPPFERLVLWRDKNDSENAVEVVPELASKLRPHQREGVQFLFECTMGLRGFEGEGCILADDMGLGKTLMSITLIWTLLQQGFHKTGSACQKIMVVCPTSLVGNWDNELRKWLGGKCPTFPVKSEPKKIIRNFVAARGKGVLILSYETQRRYSDMFQSRTPAVDGGKMVVDMVVCDEAHKLKNAESGLAKSLAALPARKRVLLSGTPMQNELSEFFNMVDFCNPGVLGTAASFRKRYERPILAARELDADERDVARAAELQKELSTIVNEFILKRGNILNARHLPPKLTQIVCCRLTPLQDRLYDTLLESKAIRHVRDGLQKNALNSIRQMLNICAHPKQVLDAYQEKVREGKEDEELAALGQLVLSDTEYMQGSAVASASAARVASNQQRSSLRHDVVVHNSIDPEQSGKMLVLYRLMQALRTMDEGDRIVVVSNYTSTLDLIGTMCQDNNWPVLRLDGSTNLSKRTRLVDEFNDPGSGAFVFLLSSKAGGCGINLIGGNRLVLFDPDWNPASDKQAAGRIWREGQQKRCFIYRFTSTSTVEEKILQRQLSKEGLTTVVEDREATNTFSTDELKTLFVRRKDTISDTHDALRCKRCSSVKTYSIKKPSAMTSWQEGELLEFMDDFLKEVKTRAGAAEVEAEATALHSVQRLLQEQHDCRADDPAFSTTFSSLPIFSRALRQAVKELDQEDPLLQAGISMLSEFMSRWSDLVPQLQRTISETDYSEKASDSGDGKGKDDDEMVPQEGCPDDDDFNRWSHHCSVNTTDDEALKRAMGDDEAVTFVFGLEVNWDLLQLREAERKDAEALRKEQCRKDLEELNKRRAAERAQAAAPVVDEVAETGSGDANMDIKLDFKTDAPVTENGEKGKPKKEKNKNKKKKERGEVTTVIDDGSDEDIFADAMTKEAVLGTAEAMDVGEDNDDNGVNGHEVEVEDVEVVARCKERTSKAERKKRKKEKALRKEEKRARKQARLQAQGEAEAAVEVAAVAVATDSAAVVEAEEVADDQDSADVTTNNGFVADTINTSTQLSKKLTVTIDAPPSQSSQGSLDRAARANRTWDCPLCTYSNAMNKSRCSMCTMRRPKLKASSKGRIKSVRFDSPPSSPPLSSLTSSSCEKENMSQNGQKCHEHDPRSAVCPLLQCCGMV